MNNMPSILSPDFGLLFWMLLAFLIVFGLLAKYGFPVIVGMVEARKQYIDESLQRAREANERLAGVQAESENLLRQAREQQAQILKEAMAARDNILQQARTEALDEGQKLLAEAKAQIEVEKENALRQVRATVVDLSIRVAEKLVNRQLEPADEQQRFAEQMLTRIED